MHKTVLAALPLLLLAIVVPAASAATTSHRATLSPLGSSGVRGTARLHDGAKRDRVRLSVRGLARGQRYSWSVRKARAGSACAGDVIGAFSYRALRKGRARAGDRSRGFAAAEGTSYAVVVSTAGGRDLACGEFRTKAAPQQVAEEPDDASSLDDDSADEDSLDDESVDDESFDPDEDMPDADEDDLDDDGDDDF